MLRMRTLPLLVVGLCIAPDAFARNASVLRPRNDHRAAARAAAESQSRRTAHQRDLPTFLHDTRRNRALRAQGLLTSPQARAARAAKAATITTTAGVTPDTVRILIARVGFQANREPSLTSVPAGGDFLLAPDSTVVVDPPPHDAHYFDALLLAMRSFYDVMSDGQLVVLGTVFPAQNDSTIQLTDPADYGPGRGGRWTIELLEAYFRDAIGLLDSTATARGVDLHDFDSFVIAHPGSDLQNDINGDSPNDLPTFFITLADSIVVQGDREIRNGLVFPETLSQDGLIGGTLGGLCHEFGHQLGLPDWYDTFYGLPVVGEWSLMDSGNATTIAFQVEGSDEVIVGYGMVPASFSAVDRILLGWEIPAVLQAPEDQVTLRPLNSSQGAGPRSARIPFAADESFVIENRRDLLYELPPDSLETEPCPYLNRDEATGVILWLSKDDPSKPSRARRNSREYDYFIASPSAPAGALGACGELGFGLMVWRFDERVFVDGYPFNEVNIDADQKSLRIVEASGDFEIGDYRLPGPGFFGDGYNDPFRSGFATQLGPRTVPNNWNNDWAQTGWEITDIQEAPPESHTLFVRAADGIPGWPRSIVGGADTLLLDVRGAVAATIAGAGPTLVCADDTGLYAFGAGEDRWALHRGRLRTGSIAFHPRLVASDADGTLAALDSNGVWLWDAALQGDSARVRTGFPLALPGGAGDRLVLFDDASGAAGGLAETRGGAWLRFDVAGLVANSFDLNASGREADPVVGPFGPGGTTEVGLVSGTHVAFGPLTGGAARSYAHGLDAPDSLLITAGGSFNAGVAHAQLVVLRRDDGRLRLVDPGQGVRSEYPDLPRATYVGLAVGDVNGDGEADVVAASPTAVVAISSRGAALLGTPITLRDAYAVQRAPLITAGPLLMDLVGDALPEIIVTTDLGLVYAFDAGGTIVDGFPRKLLADLFPPALLAADLDTDATSPELLAVTGIAVNVVAPAGGSSRAGWAHVAGDGAHSRSAPRTTPVAAAARLRASERLLLAYPNPARTDVVQLRITALQAGPFDLRIYTLEGEQVFARSGTLEPGTQEVPWRCADLAPGMYFCRFVSAAAGVETAHVEPICLVR